jgi:hypothetical protein
MYRRPVSDIASAGLVFVINIGRPLSIPDPGPYGALARHCADTLSALTPSRGFRRRSRLSRERAGVRWGFTGAVAALMLGQTALQAQDTLVLTVPDVPGQGVPPEADMRSRVAAEFPDALLVRFRKVRQIATEANQDIEFCGQVSAASLGQLDQNYQIFLYGRTGTAESVRILGSESLNGYRIGRKLIGALKRVGCL